MTPCSGCGAEAVGNFCSVCGASLADSGSEPILLGQPAPHPEATIDRVRSSPTRRTALVGLAILAFVAVGLWRFQAQSDATDSDAESAEVSENAAAQTDSDAVETAPVKSPVGRPGDWFVVVQSMNGIARIDATTGAIEDLGLDGSLLGEAWGRVLIRRLDGDLQLIDLDSLGGDLPIGSGQITDGSALGPNSQVLRGSRPGLAWIIQGFDGPAAQVNTSTGEVVRTLQPDERTGWFDLSPDFTTPLAGGVYALQDDDSYRWMMEGRVSVEGPGRILVDRCDRSLVCEHRWVDPESGEDLPQFFYPGYDESRWVQGLPGGRFMATDDLTIFDSETGETLRLDTREADAVWERRVSVSPDARLIATRLFDGQIRLRPIDSDARVTVDGVTGGAWQGAPVFVPRSEN